MAEAELKAWKATTPKSKQRASLAQSTEPSRPAARFLAGASAAGSFWLSSRSKTIMENQSGAVSEQ